ncbi:AraC family transcriptional regulator [Allorhizobium undicola]|uniref:AraC family transcriptional regulator n=1 Tax=Allorhizobium undicola TaxID=78527 RepID=UPI0004845BFB|nr:AraC family transcriptional regulator [Allorhizobium undicola]
MANSDTIQLWHDRHLLGGTDVLKARCQSYRYAPHAHDFFVVAAFSGGAQKHRIAHMHGVALPGSVMIIPPGEVHTGESAARDVSWSYSAFYPSAASLERLAEGLYGTARGSLDFGTSFLIEDREMAQRLVAAADVAASCPDLVGRQEAVLGAFEMLIRRYGRRAHFSHISSPPKAPIQRSLDYIREQLAERLSIEEIAGQSGLSEFHFMRLFKQQTGMTVHQYVNNLRLEAAKAMLVEGMPAACVAANVGFYDQSHFIGHFRKAFGLTPNRYASACR